MRNERAPEPSNRGQSLLLTQALAARSASTVAYWSAKTGVAVMSEASKENPWPPLPV